jgi:hypothetical protein
LVIEKIGIPKDLGSQILMTDARSQLRSAGIEGSLSFGEIPLGRRSTMSVDGLAVDWASVA